MPRGPSGEKRPAGTVENAIHMMRVATGEMEEELPSATRNGGLKGGPARAKALTPKRRKEIAQMGAFAQREKARAE